jgi:hypothetical protein
MWRDSFQPSSYQSGRWGPDLTVGQPGRSARLVDVNHNSVNNDSQFGQRYSRVPYSARAAARDSTAERDSGSQAELHTPCIPIQPIHYAVTNESRNHEQSVR